MLYIAAVDQPNVQICQLRADTFATEEECVEVLRRVIRAMVADPTTKPYQARDEILQEMGATGKGKDKGKCTSATGEGKKATKVRKKPAASNCDTGDAQVEEMEAESEAPWTPPMRTSRSCACEFDSFMKMDMRGEDFFE